MRILAASWVVGSDGAQPVGEEGVSDRLEVRDGAVSYWQWPGILVMVAAVVMAC